MNKTPPKTRVLVTDDSAFMRRAIRQMLEEEPDIEVVAVAHDGKMALEYAKEYEPDVITLDIEMPVMDGLTALRHIMRQMPTQVLMISSLTTEGSMASLQALRMGAADVIAKEHSTCAANILEIKSHLVSRVRELARSRKPRTNPSAPAAPSIGVPKLNLADYKMVAIGSSTGGPPALEKILPALPADFPLPVVIAQHMPLIFTQSMAKRLDDVCPMKVVHADHGTPILPGQIHLAPGAQHLHVTQRAGRLLTTVNDEPKQAAYKPSVSALFESCAKTIGKQTLGIVLTGIGDDGLTGAQSLHALGATLVAQDEASSVVYGMPRAIADAGIATAQLNPEAIAVMLQNMVGKRAA
ncbi:MAG: protein-glutamate methylesterase/protein-glutamine glutaminase [Phycisphaeraceae bacterium]